MCADRTIDFFFAGVMLLCSIVRDMDTIIFTREKYSAIFSIRKFPCWNRLKHRSLYPALYPSSAFSSSFFSICNVLFLARKMFAVTTIMCVSDVTSEFLSIEYQFVLNLRLREVNSRIRFSLLSFVFPLAEK